MTEATGRLDSAVAGRYRIEKQLGAGGTATVYLAADLKHERKVALKVLKPELAGVLGAERFVQRAPMSDVSSRLTSSPLTRDRPEAGSAPRVTGSAAPGGRTRTGSRRG